MTPERFRFAQNRAAYSKRYKNASYHTNSSAALLIECIEELERVYDYLGINGMVDYADWCERSERNKI